MQNIITHQTATTSSHAYSHRMVLKLEPGESRSLKYGGDGYQIHGKAIADLADEVKVDWEFSKLSVEQDLGPPPSIPYPDDLTESQLGQWYQEWLETDEGQQTRKRMTEHFNEYLLTYGAKVAEDGRFEVSDLPRGKYTLSINLDSPPADGRFDTQFLGSGETAFEISEAADRGDSINVGDVVVTKQAKKPTLFGD